MMGFNFSRTDNKEATPQVVDYGPPAEDRLPLPRRLAERAPLSADAHADTYHDEYVYAAAQVRAWNKQAGSLDDEDQIAAALSERDAWATYAIDMQRIYREHRELTWAEADPRGYEAYWREQNAQHYVGSVVPMRRDPALTRILRAVTVARGARGHRSQGQGGGGAAQRSSSSSSGSSDGSGSGDGDGGSDEGPAPPKNRDISRADLLAHYDLPPDFYELRDPDTGKALTARQKITLVAGAFLFSGADAANLRAIMNFSACLWLLGLGAGYRYDHAAAAEALLAVEASLTGGTVTDFRLPRDVHVSGWGTGGEADDEDEVSPGDLERLRSGRYIVDPTYIEVASLVGSDDPRTLDPAWLGQRLQKSPAVLNGWLATCGRGPAQRLAQKWLDSGLPRREEAGGDHHLADRVYAKNWAGLTEYLTRIFAGDMDAMLHWLLNEDVDDPVVPQTPSAGEISDDIMQVVAEYARTDRLHHRCGWIMDEIGVEAFIGSYGSAQARQMARAWVEGGMPRRADLATQEGISKHSLDRIGRYWKRAIDMLGEALGLGFAAGARQLMLGKLDLGDLLGGAA